MLHVFYLSSYIFSSVYFNWQKNGHRIEQEEEQPGFELLISAIWKMPLIYCATTNARHIHPFVYLHDNCRYISLSLSLSLSKIENYFVRLIFLQITRWLDGLQVKSLFFFLSLSLSLADAIPIEWSLLVLLSLSILYYWICFYLSVWSNGSSLSIYLFLVHQISLF